MVPHVLVQSQAAKHLGPGMTDDLGVVADSAGTSCGHESVCDLGGRLLLPLYSPRPLCVVRHDVAPVPSPCKPVCLTGWSISSWPPSHAHPGG